MNRFQRRSEAAALSATLGVVAKTAAELVGQEHPLTKAARDAQARVPKRLTDGSEWDTLTNLLEGPFLELDAEQRDIMVARLEKAMTGSPGEILRGLRNA